MARTAKIKPVISIWTDGSVSRQQGPGGWAYVMKAPVGGEIRTKEGSSGVPETTSQRMELQAAISALSEIRGSQKARVFSDSQYLVNGMTSGKMHELHDYGWPKKVANWDLWSLLVVNDQWHQVEWIKIKGHSGIPENERADVLAKGARDQMSAEIRDLQIEAQKGIAEAREDRVQAVEGLPDIQRAQKMVREASEPRRLVIGDDCEALNPRTYKWEPGVLWNRLDHTAMVLFNSTKQTGGYGPAGKSGKYRPLDELPLDRVRGVGS